MGSRSCSEGWRCRQKKKKEMGPPPGCKVSVEKNLETGREQGQRAEKWRRGSSGGMTKVEPPAE